MYRMFFASYSGLLRNINIGLVQPQELVNGLFYFDAKRDYVMEPEKFLHQHESVNIIQDPQKRAHILNLIKHAVLDAEAAGRIVWRVGNESRDPDKLNQFLDQNGIRRVAFGARDRVTNAELRAEVRRQGIPLDVIY